MHDLTDAERRLALGFVVVMSVLGITGVALSPYLLVHQPHLLVLLNPDGRHLVLAAPELSVWEMLALGAPRRMLSLLATYALARVYGQRALAFAGEKLKTVSRIAAFLERALVKVGAPLLVVFPTHSLAALAGATARPVRWFLLPLAIGQVPFVLAHYYFGEAIGAWTAKLTAYLAQHVWEATGVMCLIVAVQQLVVRLRRRRIEREELSEQSG